MSLLYLPNPLFSSRYSGIPEEERSMSARASSMDFSTSVLALAMNEQKFNRFHLGEQVTTQQLEARSCFLSTM